jgi:hypothetical protein
VKQNYLQKHIKMQQHPQTQTERYDEAPLSCLLDAAYFNIHQGKIKSDYHQLQTNYTSRQYTNEFTIFGCSSFVLYFTMLSLTQNHSALNDESILKNEFQKT